nr:unnamed protein product [Callosobruchus chinensis]
MNRKWAKFCHLLQDFFPTGTVTARLQWARAHQDWLLTQWRNVLFSDESRFGLVSDDYQERVWSERLDPRLSGSLNRIALNGLMHSRLDRRRLLRLLLSTMLQRISPLVYEAEPFGLDKDSFSIGDNEDDGCQWFPQIFVRDGITTIWSVEQKTRLHSTAEYGVSNHQAYLEVNDYKSEVNLRDHPLKQPGRLSVCLSDLCRQNCAKENKLGYCADGVCHCV